MHVHSLRGSPYWLAPEAIRGVGAGRKADVGQRGQSARHALSAVPQLGSRASSGRAWRPWAARHSDEEASPLGAQPPPRLETPPKPKPPVSPPSTTQVWALGGVLLEMLTGRPPWFEQQAPKGH